MKRLSLLILLSFVILFLGKTYAAKEKSLAEIEHEKLSMKRNELMEQAVRMMKEINEEEIAKARATADDKRRSNGLEPINWEAEEVQKQQMEKEAAEAAKKKQEAEAIAAAAALKEQKEAEEAAKKREEMEERRRVRDAKKRPNKEQDQNGEQPQIKPAVIDEPPNIQKPNQEIEQQKLREQQQKLREQQFQEQEEQKKKDAEIREKQLLREQLIRESQKKQQQQALEQQAQSQANLEKQKRDQQLKEQQATLEKQKREQLLRDQAESEKQREQLQLKEQQAALEKQKQATLEKQKIEQQAAKEREIREIQRKLEEQKKDQYPIPPNANSIPSITPYKVPHQRPVYNPPQPQYGGNALAPTATTSTVGTNNVQNGAGTPYRPNGVNQGTPNTCVSPEENAITIRDAEAFKKKFEDCVNELNHERVASKGFRLNSQVLALIGAISVVIFLVGRFSIGPTELRPLSAETGGIQIKSVSQFDEQHEEIVLVNTSSADIEMTACTIVTPEGHSYQFDDGYVFAKKTEVSIASGENAKHIKTPAGLQDYELYDSRKHNKLYWTSHSVWKPGQEAELRDSSGKKVCSKIVI